MYRKRIAALFLVLCLGLLSGCWASPAPETTAPTVVALPVARVQLAENYAFPLKEALLSNGYLLEGHPELLITDTMPQALTCRTIFVGNAQAAADDVFVIDFAWEEAATQQVALLSQLPNSGDVNRDGVISYAIIAPTGSSYKSAATEAMAQLPGKTELLSKQSCLDDQSVGQEMAARVLRSYGKDLDVLLCGSEAISLGAADAAKDAGRETNKDLILLTCGQDIPRSSGSVYADPAELASAILELIPLATPTQTTIPLSIAISET